LIEKLSHYLQDKSSMTQPEVSFACYIFGETKNPAGKDILLQLTYDENYRVRSSATNALGKIKYDTSDIAFINKVSARLEECVNERSEKKLYNKDLAFALGNYVSPTSFNALMNLLSFPYYGARFTAAESMKKFPQLQGLSVNQIPQEKIPLIAFAYSLTDLRENDFKTFIDFIKMMPAGSDDEVAGNLISIIQLRKVKSTDTGFIAWSETEISELQSRVKLKAH
jgi:hypothetical protein